MLDYVEILNRAGVPKNKADDCMLWAFGNGWNSMELRNSDMIWNDRHSDLFVIKGSDGIIDCLLRIGEAYNKNRR